MRDLVKGVFVFMLLSLVFLVSFFGWVVGVEYLGLGFLNIL